MGGFLDSDQPDEPTLNRGLLHDCILEGRYHPDQPLALRLRVLLLLHVHVTSARKSGAPCAVGATSTQY